MILTAFFPFHKKGKILRGSRSILMFFFAAAEAPIASLPAETGRGTTRSHFR